MWKFKLHPLVYHCTILLKGIIILLQSWWVSPKLFCFGFLDHVSPQPVFCFNSFAKSAVTCNMKFSILNICYKKEILNRLMTLFNFWNRCISFAPWLIIGISPTMDIERKILSYLAFIRIFLLHRIQAASFTYSIKYSMENSFCETPSALTGYV